MVVRFYFIWLTFLSLSLSPSLFFSFIRRKRSNSISDIASQNDSKSGTNLLPTEATPNTPPSPRKTSVPSVSPQLPRSSTSDELRKGKKGLSGSTSDLAKGSSKGGGFFSKLLKVRRVGSHWNILLSEILWHKIFTILWTLLEFLKVYVYMQIRVCMYFRNTMWKASCAFTIH